MGEDFSTLMNMLPFLIPLFLLQLALLIIALVDLVKREHVRGGNKIVWALVIVFISVIGPIIYLLLGRKENIVDSD
jgi:hypothetical protein